MPVGEGRRGGHGPSLLAGWARGHVLTHVARNADGHINFLTWARTGVYTPQYPTPCAREAEIAEGAGGRSRSSTRLARARTPDPGRRDPPRRPGRGRREDGRRGRRDGGGA
ncbi:maleylpyruvate isomerase N-terminal domain-containing protein [Sphaerisporangium sp. NPDC049003]|uniref:maleylpyruvate isomerase N-terminal domain-containing protein n=1 Tax=Sphaerisporangium sp. NPDC049003 TaxID=3364517 RepID=UPI003715DB24